MKNNIITEKEKLKLENLIKRKNKRPNFLDILIYRIFWKRWSPIFHHDVELREYFFDNLRKFTKTECNEAYISKELT